jgi:hypothetical protein
MRKKMLHTSSEIHQTFETLKKQFSRAKRYPLDHLKYELMETAFLTRLEIPEMPAVHHLLARTIEEDGTFDEFLESVEHLIKTAA